MVHTVAKTTGCVQTWLMLTLAQSLVVVNGTVLQIVVHVLHMIVFVVLMFPEQNNHVVVGHVTMKTQNNVV
jgi:hypothetical protein